MLPEFKYLIQPEHYYNKLHKMKKYKLNILLTLILIANFSWAQNDIILVDLSLSTISYENEGKAYEEYVYHPERIMISIAQLIELEESNHPQIIIDTFKDLMPEGKLLQMFEVLPSYNGQKYFAIDYVANTKEDRLYFTKYGLLRKGPR